MSSGKEQEALRKPRQRMTFLSEYLTVIADGGA